MIKISFLGSFLICAIAILLTGLSNSFGQVTIDEFLRSANEAINVKVFDEQVNYLQGKPYRLSPLQKLEFRTRSNQLDPARQDYAIRFNPANPWEIRSTNNYFKEYLTSLSLEKEMVFKKALAVRYFLVIELLVQYELKSLIEEDVRLTNAQLSILEQQRFTTGFDGGDYVKLKMAQLDKTVEMEGVKFDITNQVGKIESTYPKAYKQALDWDFKNIISIAVIDKVIDSMGVTDAPSAVLAFRSQKVNLATQEYKLEKSNVNVGFIQTQYEPYRIEQNKQPWNLSLGITIPITNPNKGDMTKQQLKVIEAKYALEETKSELQSEKDMSKDKLKSLILRYREMQTKITELEEGSLAGTLKTLKDNNALISVQFNTNINKLKSILLKLRESILITYIEFLGYTDRLQQRPLVNYLSGSLEEIR